LKQHLQKKPAFGRDLLYTTISKKPGLRPGPPIYNDFKKTRQNPAFGRDLLETTPSKKPGLRPGPSIYNDFKKTRPSPGSFLKQHLQKKPGQKNGIFIGVILPLNPINR
jgi:hypothetical protein